MIDDSDAGPAIASFWMQTIVTCQNRGIQFDAQFIFLLLENLKNGDPTEFDFESVFGEHTPDEWDSFITKHFSQIERAGLDLVDQLQSGQA
jgi:hypothetical protein